MVFSTPTNSTPSPTHILSESISQQHRRSPLAPAVKRDNLCASKISATAHSSSLSLPLTEPPTSPTRALSPIVGGAAVAMKKLLMRRGRPTPGINSVAPTLTTATEDDRLFSLNESLERTRLTPSVQSFITAGCHGTDAGVTVHDLDAFESPCQSPAFTISSLEGRQGSYQSPSIASPDNSPLSTPTGTLRGPQFGRSASSNNNCRRSFEHPRADSLLELYIEKRDGSGQSIKRRSTPIECKVQPQMVMDEISTRHHAVLHVPESCSLKPVEQNHPQEGGRPQILGSIESTSTAEEPRNLDNDPTLSASDIVKPTFVQTTVPSPKSRPLSSSGAGHKPTEGTKDGQQSQPKSKPRSGTTRQARPSLQEQTKLYENSVAFLAMYHTGGFAVEKLDQRQPKSKKESRRLSTGVEWKEMSQRFARRQSESCLLTKVVKHVREGSREVAMETGAGLAHLDEDSSIEQRSSTSSRSDGTIIVSCRASPTQFYDAQRTRNALRLFLIKDGPEFDDLIEFGFPAETFLEKDDPQGEEKADRNELMTEDLGPLSNQQQQQQQQEERRFMTLRVTLTPWHARADESTLYGKTNGPQKIMPDAEMLDTQPQDTLLSPSLLNDEDDSDLLPGSTRPLSATTMPEVRADRRLSPYSMLDFNRSESCLKLSCFDPQDPFASQFTENSLSEESVVIPPRTLSITDTETTFGPRRARSRTQSSSSANTLPPLSIRSQASSSPRMGLVSPPGGSISSQVYTSPPLTPSSWSSPSLASFAHRLSPTSPPLQYQPRYRKESSSTWSTATESIEEGQGPQASYPSPPAISDTITESGRKELASNMFFSDASSIGNGSSPKRRPQPIPIPVFLPPPPIWDVSLHPLDGSIPPSPSPAMATTFCRSTSLNALAFQGGPYSVSPSPSRSHFPQANAQTHGGRQEYVPPSVRAGPRRPSVSQSPNRRMEEHGVTNSTGHSAAGALSPPLSKSPPMLPRMGHRYPVNHSHAYGQSGVMSRRPDGNHSSSSPTLTPSTRSPRQVAVESEPLHREVIFETSEKVILNTTRSGTSGYHSAEIYVGKNHGLEMDGIETNHGENGHYPLSCSTPGSPLTATMNGKPWNNGSRSLRAPTLVRPVPPQGRPVKPPKAESDIVDCYQDVSSMVQQGEPDHVAVGKEEVRSVERDQVQEEEEIKEDDDDEEGQVIIVQRTRRLSISRPPKPIVLDHLPPSPSLPPHSRNWIGEGLKGPATTATTTAWTGIAGEAPTSALNGPATSTTNNLRGRSLTMNQRKRGGIVGGPFDGPVGAFFEGMDMSKEDQVRGLASPKEDQPDYRPSYPSLEYATTTTAMSTMVAPLMEQPSNSVIYTRRRADVPPTTVHVIKAMAFP